MAIIGHSIVLCMASVSLWFSLSEARQPPSLRFPVAMRPIAIDVFGMLGVGVTCCCCTVDKTENGRRSSRKQKYGEQRGKR